MLLHGSRKSGNARAAFTTSSTQSDYQLFHERHRKSTSDSESMRFISQIDSPPPTTVTTTSNRRAGSAYLADLHQPIGFVCCQCRYHSSGSYCSNPEYVQCPHKTLPRCSDCPIIFTSPRLSHDTSEHDE
ncbi:hypothetical protein F5X97DRAFT_94691 [Nemania serpens]|nr:hypothetical protein F5X97DRAFT_94691 [Nemania serpens]